MLYAWITGWEQERTMNKFTKTGQLTRIVGITETLGEEFSKIGPLCRNFLM